MKNKFISKVFQWLCIGLLITFGLGYSITLNEHFN
jgi:FtsH-binding integral membrane protein